MTEDEAEVNELCLEEMADFCLALGYTPAQFWDLTVEEHQALIKAHNKKNKQKGA